MPITFEVRFDGLDAENHRLDMRLFGRSLIGFERAVSDSLFLASEGRLPHPRERRSLVVKVIAPHAACLDYKAIVEAAPNILPFAHDLLNNPGTKFLFEFLSYLLKLKGGKPKEAEAHLIETFRIAQQMHSADLEDRRHERESIYANEDRWRQHSLQLADRLGSAVKEIVAPVGPSSETLRLTAPDGALATVVDVPMAEAVRSREPLEVGEMTKMKVRVDGMIKHTRQLKVELADNPGRFVNAEVRDPAFDQRPNAYTRAFDNDDFLEVDAKATYKDGELLKLHIMNAAA
jgi:hypothetical protein